MLAPSGEREYEIVVKKIIAFLLTAFQITFLNSLWCQLLAEYHRTCSICRNKIKVICGRCGWIKYNTSNWCEQHRTIQTHTSVQQTLQTGDIKLSLGLLFLTLKTRLSHSQVFGFSRKLLDKKSKIMIMRRATA